MPVTLPSLTATWHNTAYPAIDPTQAHLSVKGKAILITGGGRGIGAKIARSFAAAGASLITITGRTLSSLESSKSAIVAEFPSTKVLIAKGDVTDEAAMDSAFADLSQANGGKGIDICIHNAGYLPNVNLIAQAETSDWWSGFSINVLGSFIVTRAFIKHKNTSPSADPVLLDVGTGAICLTPQPKLSGYAVSKFAQSRFFEAVATEETGIRIMQVSPGVIMTDMGNKSLNTQVELPKDDGKFIITDFYFSDNYWYRFLWHVADLDAPCSLPSGRLHGLGCQSGCRLPKRQIYLVQLGRGGIESEKGANPL
jgi:NAD(P)-dependent dehydrogenase (short-subunit alcohol dehydrogenase family)